MAWRRPVEPGAADDPGRELVERWRRGDASAFGDIFDAYGGLVHRVLHHLLGPDSEIEDAMQNTFVEVLRSLDRFEGRSRLSSFIARIAIHTGYRHLRRRRSRPLDRRVGSDVPDVSDESPAGDPEAGVRRAELIAEVRSILSRLAPKKRSVFMLHELEGMSQEEIAEVVGARVATVRTRLFYARREFWRHARESPLLEALGGADGDGALTVPDPSRDKGAT